MALVTTETGQALPQAETGWTARLELNYHLAAGRTVCQTLHEGPLRVLQALYPEGDAVCHHVLVHPPGGLVAGDVVSVNAVLAQGAHAFITTPGATRFYRSTGPVAVQRVQAKLGPNARLEWLPLETIAYNQCQAESQWVFALDQGAELMAWDVLALGLPHARQPFEQGRYLQHLEVEGVWMDRGTIDALDHDLMNGPLGLDGYRCLGTLVLAADQALSVDRVEAGLAQARAATESMSGAMVGVTLAHPRVRVARVLSAQVEPCRAALQAIWSVWRESQWAMKPEPSRMWRV
jgi:urease accessory protein